MNSFLKSLLLFSIVILFLIQCGSGERDKTINTAIIPTEREGAPYEQFLIYNNIIQQQNGNIDLLFIGDSITRMWSTDGQEVWKSFYSDRNAIQIGIDADRTQHILWRLENGNVDNITPKVTILLIGINNSPDSRNTTSEILEGVKAVVSSIRNKLPDTKIILMGIFPYGKTFNKQRGKITQVNQALSKLHNGENIFFLDIGHLFIDENGVILPAIMPDALHLSEQGYKIWAESMEPLILEMLGK